MFLVRFHSVISLPWIPRFFHEKNPPKSRETKNVKQKAGFWMDFVFLPLILFYFQNHQPIAVWVVWNFTPPSIDSFHSVGVHSTRATKNRKSRPKNSRGFHRPFCSYVLWIKVEHLTRSCHHPWHSDDSHCSGVKGDPPREASVSRSNWAQNPKSRAAARQFNHRWCWDTWRRRVLLCWITSDCRIHKERSGSCNKRWHRWHLYTEMFWGKDPLQPDRNFQLCVPKLQSTSFGHHQRLGDAHWWTCLCTLHILDEHHHGWVCDAYWGRCLWRVQIFDKHHHGESVTHIAAGAFRNCTSLTSITMGESVTHTLGNVPLQSAHLWRASPLVSLWSSLGTVRGLCLVHIFDEHHHGWVCDAYWGRCLWRVQIFDEHHHGWVCDTH